MSGGALNMARGRDRYIPRGAERVIAISLLGRDIPKAATLTGLRKRGYAIVINGADKARGSVYRIEPSDMGGDSAAPQTATEATGKARQERLQRGARPRSGQAA